jgi:hypothetical protein
MVSLLSLQVSLFLPRLTHKLSNKTVVIIAFTGSNNMEGYFKNSEYGRRFGVTHGKTN